MLDELQSVRIETGQLLQHVSRVEYRDTALYFGRDGTNRYDVPGRDHGVLYLARDLPTALMETVFHGHRWHEGERRAISYAEVCSRMVRVVGVLQELRLADLTAAGVMAAVFGLTLEQMAGRGYAHTQKVSGLVHAMRDGDDAPLFDGLQYPSRNNYPGPAVALFERASAKVRVVADIDLPDHADWPCFVSGYRIGVVPDEAP